VELSEIFSQLGYDCKLSLDIGGSLFTIIEPARTRELLAIAFYNLDVNARNDEKSTLTSYLLWDDPFWIIRTEIWVEAEVGGMTLLQHFPERQVKSFEECVTQLNASIDDLFASHHLLIEWLSSKRADGEKGADWWTACQRKVWFITLYAFPAVRGKVAVKETIVCLAFRALELSIIAPPLFR